MLRHGLCKERTLARPVTKKDGKWVVNGTKYYSDCNLFSDWIDVYGQQDPEGRDDIAVVNTHQDGFGQRTTGSGTSVLSDAVVEEGNIIGFDTRYKYQTAFFGKSFAQKLGDLCCARCASTGHSRKGHNP